MTTRADPLLNVVRESWINTGPEWDSMVTLTAQVRDYGFTPMQWRVHPAAYHKLLEEIALATDEEGIALALYTSPGDPYGRAREVLGAPLTLDATLAETDARLLIQVDSFLLPAERAAV